MNQVTCSMNDYPLKDTNKKLVYRYINGEKIILSIINGKKVCVSCLIEKDVNDFYTVQNQIKGCCKECRYKKLLIPRIECSCGKSYSKVNKFNHITTKYHINNVKNDENN